VNNNTFTVYEKTGKKGNNSKMGNGIYFKIAG
jgi:hypothetical protein